MSYSRSFARSSRVIFAAVGAALVACADVERAVEPERAIASSASLADSATASRWLDPATWPDRQVPAAGSDVVVPAGRTIVLDGVTPELGAVRVEGRLVFAGDSVELRSRSVVVIGALEIGSDAAPFAGRAAITLLGDASSAARDGAMAKALMIAGGRLELHGAPRPAWTRMDATAAVGSDRLVLERAVPWEPGDRIVIASTDYEPAHAEERTVVDVDGSSVRLDRPLAYTHWGTVQRYGGLALDERAEVGRLTRNVVVRGDSTSERDGFGGHVMIMPGSTVHISDVELHRMGQSGRLARYPIHWHLARDASGSYARRTAVWHSYNRCVTIHGTDAVRLEDNVCYDHVGHGFFLEDGVERHNVLVGNLGVRTRRPTATTRLLASDARAATFWITNPDNTMRGNVAAGSEGFGIWYALAEHPSGLSATAGVWPRRTPLGTFDGNRAHSNVLSGLWVDEGTSASGAGEVTFYTPIDDDGRPAEAVFRGLVAYKNRQFGAWLRGAGLRLTDAAIADNMVGAAFAASDASLEDALVVGRSANAERNPDAWSPTHGFWYYDGRVGVRRTTFAEFLPTAADDARALAFFPNNPWPIDATNYAERLTFVNAARVVFDRPHGSYDGTKSAVLVDDGSVSGRAGARLVPDTPFLVDSSCARRADWSAWACGTRMVQLRVHADDGTLRRLVVRRDDGASVDVGPIAYDSTTASLTVPVGRALELRPDFVGGSAISLEAIGLGDGDVLDVLLPFASEPTRVRRVDGAASAQLPIVESLGAPRCTDCATYDSARGRLRVRLAGRRGAELALAVTP